jgi:hypothetical protein
MQDHVNPVRQSRRLGIIFMLRFRYLRRHLCSASWHRRQWVEVERTRATMDDVWMCSSPKELMLSAKLTNDWRNRELRSRMIALVEANNSGQKLKREDFPPCLYGQPSAMEADYQLTDLFFANGLPLVSSRLIEIFKEFDLGQTSFFEAVIFKKDKVTPVPGSWYFLNYGNLKSALVPERCFGLQKIGGVDRYITPGFPKKGDIILSQAALVGPDLWVDERCCDVFFVSKYLGLAIKSGGLSGFSCNESDFVLCSLE